MWRCIRLWQSNCGYLHGCMRAFTRCFILCISSSRTLNLKMLDSANIWRRTKITEGDPSNVGVGAGFAAAAQGRAQLVWTGPTSVTNQCPSHTSTPVQGEGACTWRAWRVGVQVVCERPLIGSTSACACVQTGRGGGAVARTSLPAPLHHRSERLVSATVLPPSTLCTVLYGIQYVYTINRLLRIQIVLCSYCVLGTPTRGYAAH